MNSNFNLPPGVTARDVSGPEMVPCEECDSGEIEVCEGGFVVDKAKCPTCGGTGEVRKEKYERED